MKNHLHKHQHQHGECCCEHNHSHNHEENCCEREHKHSTVQSCCGGHEHSHGSYCEHAGSGEHQATKVATSGGIQKVYLLENLGCANCAAKMERAVGALPAVAGANITFATKKLHITVLEDIDLLEEIQNICRSIESEVTVRPAEQSRQTAEPKNSWSWLAKKREVAEIIVGGALFISAEWLSLVPEAYSLYLLVIAYVLLGGGIVAAAVKNIFKGHVFDENFLMTVATLGAFAINAYEEAVGVMLFFRLGEYFEHCAVEKSRSQIMEAVDLRPETVNLCRGNEVEQFPAAQVKAGDVLLVRVGDRIPVDGTIIEGESLLDTSAVTGEPVPVRKTAGDAVLSGCINTSGMLKLRADKVLAESMVSKILQAVEQAAAGKPKMERFISRFAAVYTPLVVGGALLLAVVPGIITGSWQYWIYTALTFLVISCPCALVLSVPLAFFSGIGRASRYGILFKNGSVMEALKDLAVIVFDKTGTVTQGNFKVQQLLPAEGSAEELLSLAAGAELASAHPIGASIVKEAVSRSISLRRPDNFMEFAGEGLAAYYGSEVVLCGSSKLMERFGIAFADTSAAYGTEVFVAKNGSFKGAILISDTVKQEAKQAIASLTGRGLRTVMLTGDSQQEAEAVAHQLGISQVYGRLLPQDKLAHLPELRKKYGRVMFVGDGINDAPVLAGADVGGAMGSGADAAVEAADVVFMRPSLQNIDKAISIAEATGKIAWQNVIIALGIKLIIMAAGLAGYASMWAAVFADTGVTLICVLNSIRILYQRF